MVISPTTRIAAVVTATIVLATTLGGLYLLGEARQSETAKLERSVRDAWVMGRINGGDTLEDLVAVSRRLVETTGVTGGVARDSTNKEVARVGDVSEVSSEPSTIRERLFGRPLHAVVIHDSAHDVTLVVDAKERSSTLERAVASVLGLTLFIASLLGGFTVWFGEVWFSRPQRRIADLLEAPDAEAAEAIERKYAGPSPLGRVASAAAELSRRYVLLADAKLRRAQALLEHYPHPILVFTSTGHLAEANNAAMRVFSADSLETLDEKAPISRLLLENGTPVSKALREGAHVGPATARTPRGDLPCLLAFDRLRDPEGGPDRFVVTFVDMRSASPDIGASGDIRTGRLTANLESCRILLQAMDEVPDEGETPVDLAALVDGWREKSAERGLIGQLTCSRFPVVSGHQPTLEHILSSALHVVRGRSLSLEPDIRVEGRTERGGLAIDFIEEDEPPVASGADVSIPMAALIKLLARQGGTLVSTATTGDPNRLSLHIDCQVLPDAFVSHAA